MNVLVLCTGNSARSILLEHILNRMSGGRITAYSAGSKPSGRVHPQSLILLSQLGYDVRRTRSKSWDEFALANAPKIDIVITVCGSAAHETCPIWPGSPIRTHWGVDDPASASESEWSDVFKETYYFLYLHAEALMRTPFEDMTPDQLKSTLDKIGALS